MSDPNFRVAARLLFAAHPSAAAIVADRVRNALQPILLCAESVDDAEAIAGVGTIVEICDGLTGRA